MSAVIACFHKIQGPGSLHDPGHFLILLLHLSPPPVVSVNPLNCEIVIIFFPRGLFTFQFRLSQLVFDKKRRPPAITADSRKEKARAYAQAHQVSSVFNYLLSTSISIGLKWNPFGNANSPIVIISWFSCRYFLIPLNIILPPNISGFLRKRHRSMRFIIPHCGTVFLCLCFSCFGLFMLFLITKRILSPFFTLF